MELMPLVKSAEYDDVEGEFKALTLFLYKKYLAEKINEVAMYGMPQIGGIELIERYLSGDGLAVMTSTTEEQIRYLFHAWRFRNPQRGTMFLEAYLRTLFGPTFYINQLWCPRDGVYPTDALSETELVAQGGVLDDYYLTSRLQVDIDTTIVPLRILEAAKTAVAAKFVLEVRIAKVIGIELKVAFASWGVEVARMVGKAIYHQPEVRGSATVGIGSSSTLFAEQLQIVYSEGATVEQQRDVVSSVAVGLAAQPGAANYVFSSGAKIKVQTTLK